MGRAVAKAVVTRRHSLALDRPTVTFTFDDIPVSAATTGAAILEAHGARASFYVCGDLMGQAWDLYRLAGPDQVSGLAARGHEIGCHTVAHARISEVSRAAFVAEVVRNAAALAPVAGPRGLQTFAYPYGFVRVDVKLAIQHRFRGCRGIHDGLNVGQLDLGRIRADALENARADPAHIDRLLDETVRRGGWRVFYSHDVSDQPSRVGVTPELLAYAVAGAVRRGCAVRTMDATLARVGVPLAGLAHATGLRSAR